MIYDRFDDVYRKVFKEEFRKIDEEKTTEGTTLEETKPESGKTTFRYVNLTPHDITVVREDGTSFVVPSSKKALRLIEKDKVVKIVDGVKVVERQYKLPDDLPKNFPELYNAENIVIVPLAVLQALKGVQPEPLALVVAPDTGGGAVRDPKTNQVIGTRAFVTLSSD